MTIVILPSAKEDLAQGFAFFEDQQAGLGTYFLESLFSDIDSLNIYAGVHRRAFGYHRLLSKRFTFAVYYSFESGNRSSLRCTASETSPVEPRTCSLYDPPSLNVPSRHERPTPERRLAVGFASPTTHPARTTL
jgi:hypothetical protein